MTTPSSQSRTMRAACEGLGQGEQGHRDGRPRKPPSRPPRRPAGTGSVGGPPGRPPVPQVQHDHAKDGPGGERLVEPGGDRLHRLAPGRNSGLTTAGSTPGSRTDPRAAWGWQSPSSSGQQHRQCRRGAKYPALAAALRLSRWGTGRSARSRRRCCRLPAISAASSTSQAVKPVTTARASPRQTLSMNVVPRGEQPGRDAVAGRRNAPISPAR